MLIDKKIILCVTGGIAIYKSCELLRLLMKNNAKLNVVMTESAKRFISPLVFEAISMNPCFYDVFSLTEDKKPPHVSLTMNADLIVVAPATANIIGKIASAIADCPVSITVLSSKSPVLLAPCMHNDMWENQILQENLKKLKSTERFFIVGPEKGELLSGEIGSGRMSEPSTIFEKILYILSPKDLKDKKIVITAGPTREYIDAIRFISNPSSGKMGYALANCALRRGAKVSLISGPSYLSPPEGCKFISITSTEDLLEGVRSEIKNADILIMSAAPSDEKPFIKKDFKIKKEDFENVISLEHTPDILKALKDELNGKIVVGFAAETEDLLSNALKKMKEKKLHLVFANLITESKAPFGSDFTSGLLLSKNGEKIEINNSSKTEVANLILNKVLEFLKK